LAPRRLSKLQQWILLSILTIGTLTRNEDIILTRFATSRQELLAYRRYQHPTEAENSFNASLSRSLTNLQTKQLIHTYKQLTQPLHLNKHHTIKPYQAQWILLTRKGEDIALQLILNHKPNHTNLTPTPKPTTHHKQQHPDSPQ